MAYFNKLYPIKYKEVFIKKELLADEGVVWITEKLPAGFESHFFQATVSEVDPEFVTLDIGGTDAELSIPLRRVIYSTEVPTELFAE